jgi:predicted RNA-binding Zn ribbon-like protein
VATDPDLLRNAELLRDFVNTYDVAQGADDLGAPAGLAAWLHGHGLLGEQDPRPTATDLAMAVELREGLREALRQDHGRAAGAPGGSRLDAVLGSLPLRVSLAHGSPRLEPVAAGAAGAIARLAAAIDGAHADGTWHRLKVCRDDGCEWAFIDVSKNRSRAWCSMRECGNRTKTRAYRARRRAGGAPGVSEA